MKKGLLVLAAAMLVVSLASAEVASARSKMLTIGGYIDLVGVYYGPADSGIFGDDYLDISSGFVKPMINVNLTAQMTDNVAGYVELETPHTFELIGGIVKTIDPSLPIYPRGTGGDNMLHIYINQAYVDVNEFMAAEVSLRLGVQNLAYDLRGDGQALVLNVSESESVVAGAIPGVDLTQPVFASVGPPGSISEAINLLFAESEAVGWKMMYKADPVSMDAFVMTTAETIAWDWHDMAVWGVYGRYVLNDMSHVMGGVVAFSNNNRATMYTVEGGVDYWVMEDLEVYGDGAIQFGNYSNNPGAVEVEASGMAGYVGAKYVFSGVNSKPSIEGQFAYFSGDDDATDDTNDSFVSYESISDFALLEEHWYGLDVDTNYWAVKVIGSLMPKEDVTLGAKYGYFNLAEDTIDGGPSMEEFLGHEIDVMAKWQYSEDLAFSAGVAYLFGSDFFDDFVGEDTGLLARFDTVLKF